MKKTHLLIFGLSLGTLISGFVMAQNRMPGHVPKFPTLAEAGLTPAYTNIPYSTRSKTEKLDIYLPSAGKGPYPVVLYIHAGAFRVMSKENGQPAIIKTFLDDGFAVVAVDYRLSGEALFPAAVQDVFAAAEFILKSGSKFKLDGKAFVSYGNSAGANLASILGTAYNDSTFRSELQDQSSDIRPRAVIAQFPPIDFSRIDTMLTAQGCDPNQINHNSVNGFESMYLGAALPSVPQLVKAANPATYAAPNDPPFLIQNGSKDCNVGVEQSKILVQALESAGVRVHYDLIYGAGHGGPLFDTPENLAKIRNFLNPLR